MYNTPYFIPNIYSNIAPSILRNTALRGLSTNRGLGLFQRLGNSINTIKTLNWSGIINNTSKTLGIINQTIPLVKQVHPVMNNMKSMLKIASLFKDETDNNSKTYYKNKNSTNKEINPNTNIPSPKNYYKEEDTSPTFFIPS